MAKPNPRNSKPRLTDAMVAAAIRATGGRLSQAAAKLGYEHSAVYKRVKKSPALQKIVATERERLVDLAEEALIKAIERGEGWAVCFALKCLGKDRGYIERVQQEQVGEQRVVLEVIEDVDWYGAPRRQAAVAAAGDGAPAASLALPGPKQNGSVRPAVGQNGNGTHGLH